MLGAWRETSRSTAARAPSRSRKNRKPWAAVRGSDLDRHAVAGGLDLDAGGLGHLFGQLPGMRSPDAHPVVGDDGQARLRLGDDARRLGDAQVREVGPGL